MSSPRLARVVLFGLLFLFFFQLLSDFIEAIYVYGLLGQALPPEIVSVLLLLSPAVLLLRRKPLGGRALAGLGALAVACRLAEPMLGTRGRMLAAGLGVACFLILLPSLLARREEEGGETVGADLGLGLALGLSLSVLLRTLRSGSDLSTYGWFQAIGWFLAAAAAALAWRAWQPAATPTPAAGEPSFPEKAGGKPAGPDLARPGLGRIVGLSLGLMGGLVLCYFAFSSPAVIARWTGVDYLPIVVILTAALSLFTILWGLGPRLSAALTRPAVLVWNLLFVVCLVLTILGHQIRFPADPTAYPLPQPAASALHHVPLVLMLLLWPVIAVDVMLLAQDLADRRPSPRALGAAFALAGLLLLFLILAQIFTTVYDYIPVAGPPFRDRFWLVFALAGAAMALPLLLVRRCLFRLGRRAGGVEVGPAFPGLVLLLSLLTVAGAWLVGARPATPAGSPTSLRVATYNIQQGYDEAGQRNYDGQLGVLQQLDADVIGLQECDTARIANGNADVVRFLADRLDLYSYYGPKTVAGTFGIALLSRYPILNPHTFCMCSAGEQTATIAAEIDVGGRRFHLFVTHLGNGGPLVQQEAILREVGGLDDVILMGDFNFRPDTDQYRLTTERLADSWLVRWPGGAPEQGIDPADRIDHIFLSPGLEVVESRYLPSPESDHPAMTTVVGW